MVSANLLADWVLLCARRVLRVGGKSVPEEREVRGEPRGWSSNPASALDP